MENKLWSRSKEISLGASIYVILVVTFPLDLSSKDCIIHILNTHPSPPPLAYNLSQKNLTASIDTNPVITEPQRGQIS